MERGPRVSLPFLFDALLFVAPGIHVEVEVVPLVAGREGDGLPQREAHGVDDPLPARLARAHAHRGGAAGGAQQVGRGGEVMELPVVQDALPDGMAELLRDLEAHQILQGKVQGLAGQPQGKLDTGVNTASGPPRTTKAAKIQVATHCRRQATNPGSGGSLWNRYVRP